MLAIYSYVELPYTEYIYIYIHVQYTGAPICNIGQSLLIIRDWHPDS